MTILQLLEQLQIDPRLVAVEHNLSIIKPARYESTFIADGPDRDREFRWRGMTEIVNFVGRAARTSEKWETEQTSLLLENWAT